MNLNPSRREFSATALGLPAALGAVADGGDAVAFFVVGDTHFLAGKEDPAKIDPRSAKVTSKLIDTLNRLPGTEIPAAAGGGKVLAPRGVIHAGDCIDTGDKASVAMQRTEWSAFTDAFGLAGGDGRLKVPVYEVHGNHDSPRGDGLAVARIMERNKKRPGVTNLSPNGVHYSWDWAGVHFVCLGIVVGHVADVGRARRYAPLGSLDFLRKDLEEKVGRSGRPVILVQHVDMLRYSLPLPVDDRKAMTMEWDPADVRGYHDAIKGYNIAGIFYGHTHARNIYRWDGSAKPAAEGLPVFNVDNSSHFAGNQQAFFYVELRAGVLTAREYQTNDAWESGSWTPRTWTASHAAAAR